MYHHCPDCHRTYNDNHHSTSCPHRGIGFCAVCDCVICLCTNDGTCGDWERSSNFAKEEHERVNTAYNLQSLLAQQQLSPPPPYPGYISHKRVWAAKIKRVHRDEDGQGVVLIFSNPSFPPRAITAFSLENKPVPQDGMWFVRYEDGYFSFSPAQAFESGYTLEPEKTATAITERTQPMDTTSATTSATTPAPTPTNPFIQEEGWPQTHGQPSTVTFTIQSGPIREHGVNGCQIDDVVAWAKEKIEGFNAAFPCRENSLVITKLDEALLWLMKRRLDREKRQVEGTSQR